MLSRDVSDNDQNQTKLMYIQSNMMNRKSTRYFEEVNVYNDVPNLNYYTENFQPTFPKKQIFFITELFQITVEELPTIREYKIFVLFYTKDDLQYGVLWVVLYERLTLYFCHLSLKCFMVNE